MKFLLKKIKEYFQATDYILLILSVSSSLFGLVLIWSATHSYGTNRFVMVQSAAILIGILIFIVFSLVDFESLSDLWPYAYAGSLVFIGLLFFFGTGGDGSNNKNWLNIGITNIQPAEIVKVIFIFTFSKFLTNLEQEEDINSPSSIIKMLLHFGIIAGFIVLIARDIGITTIYAMTFLGMTIAAGLKLRYYIISLGVAAASFPILWFYVLKEYQKNRFLVAFNPEIDPYNYGFQAIQSKIAIGSGKILGNGLLGGNQTQSGILPAKHTDFIFAVCCEELGMLGGLVLLILLSAIILRCIYLAVNARSRFSMYICVGVASMLIYQTFENVSMCLAMSPIIGITLPFMSYGGSSIISSFMAVGLVSSTYRKRSFLS